MLYNLPMAPRTRPSLPARGVEVECPPSVREGIEEMLQGEIMPLTDAEAGHLFETGEWPDRVLQWAAESPRRKGT
jgi:hypothetical protein